MEDLQMKDKKLYSYRHEVDCYLDILWLISPNKGKARTVWINGYLYKWIKI